MTAYPLVTVGGLIVATDGKVLVIRSHKWLKGYTLPGGKVKHGETCEAGFKREVFEETGVTVERAEYALMIESICSEEFHKKNYHFVMHEFIGYVSGKPQVVLNEEAEDYLWVSLEEAEKMRFNQETHLLLDWYKKRCQS